jgi:hypothetical protein
VLHVSLEDVGDRLDSPVGVPGKAGKVLGGVGRVEIVQKEERIELRHLVVTEGPLEVDAGPLDRGLASPYFSNLPDGRHGSLLSPGDRQRWGYMEHTSSTGFVEKMLITLWIVSAAEEGGPLWTDCLFLRRRRYPRSGTLKSWP